MIVYLVNEIRKIPINTSMCLTLMLAGSVQDACEMIASSGLIILPVPSILQ